MSQKWAQKAHFFYFRLTDPVNMLLYSIGTEQGIYYERS